MSQLHHKIVLRDLERLWRLAKTEERVVGLDVCEDVRNGWEDVDG
jgi:hypothetical protein